MLSASRTFCLGLGLLAVAACRAEAPAESSAPPRPSAPAFSNPEITGPYAVGLRRAWIAAESGPPIAADVFYPAAAERPPERDLYSGLQGDAVVDAPPLRGEAPYGIAVFSHGLGGIREQNTFQLSFLASHGWIALTLDHARSRIFDLIGDGYPSDEAYREVVNSAKARPGEVSAAIDHVFSWNADPHHPFYDLADTEAVAVLGHSFGGFTALAAAGAEADVPQFIDWCAKQSNFQCEILRGLDEESLVRRELDPRVKAVVPLTPGGTRVFGEAGIAKVEAPVLLMSGTGDTVAPPEVYADFIPDALEAPYVYLRFDGAAHLAFSQLCPALPREPVCGNLPVPYEVFLHRVNTYSVAFLGYYARGIEAYRTYLEPDYASNATWVAYSAQLD